MMDLLWAPVGDAYTLGPAQQEVKQTGIFPQHVFLIAITVDLFYLSKHRVRPFPWIIRPTMTDGASATPAVRCDPIPFFREKRKD
jgi:hypothetical protein